MRIDGKKSADYVKTFTEMWLSCGLACRKGSSWIKREDLPNFTDEMERRGACLHYIHRRAKAHWQSGILERQGQWLRNIWEKMMDHEVMDIEDVDYALAETCHAKKYPSTFSWVFSGTMGVWRKSEIGRLPGRGRPDGGTERGAEHTVGGVSAEAGDSHEG